MCWWGLVSADIECGFVGLCANVGLDLAFDESGGLFSQFGEKCIDIWFGALGFEHDGAVWLVADPPSDGFVIGDKPGAGSESDALDAALEDDSEACDHVTDCSG
jgi:hypothetical protein